jgi:hypothetical protein
MQVNLRVQGGLPDPAVQVIAGVQLALRGALKRRQSTAGSGQCLQESNLRWVAAR